MSTCPSSEPTASGKTPTTEGSPKQSPLEKLHHPRMPLDPFSSSLDPTVAPFYPRTRSIGEALSPAAASSTIQGRLETPEMRDKATDMMGERERTRRQLLEYLQNQPKGPNECSYIIRNAMGKLTQERHHYVEFLVQPKSKRELKFMKDEIRCNYGDFYLYGFTDDYTLLCGVHGGPHVSVNQLLEFVRIHRGGVLYYFTAANELFASTDQLHVYRQITRYSDGKPSEKWTPLKLHEFMMSEYKI